MNKRAADVARLRATLAMRPDDRVAWHNLAAAEGDLGHTAEAEAAARRAIALGIAAPETRLVLGRALQSLRKLDEAESMFKKAISLRPNYADAHRDLAQLIWMRTGRAEDAVKKLSRALRESPADAALHLVFMRARIRRRSDGCARGDGAWPSTCAERSGAAAPGGSPVHSNRRCGPGAVAFDARRAIGARRSRRTVQSVRIIVGRRKAGGRRSASRRTLQRLTHEPVRACIESRRGGCSAIRATQPFMTIRRLSSSSSSTRPPALKRSTHS